MEMPFGKTKSEFTYDQSGRLTKTVASTNDKVYMSEELFYDDNGYVIKKKQTSLDASGKESSVTTESFIFSEKGLIQSSTIITDTITTFTSYEYDAKNRLVLYTRKDALDNIIEKEQYEYLDDFGSYRLTSLDNQVTQLILDATGNELERTLFNTDGSIVFSIKNEYDSKNNVVKSTDKDRVITEFTNVYEGDLLISVEKYVDSELAGKTVNEYDEYGNLCTKKETNAAGTVVSSTVNVWLPVY
ncbi:MAG: hypothetical protein E7646_01930 [Ruminococcaceae bacterium]|nr:hypothetical protein [Oscillospiraceae bacterium]